MIRSLDLFTGYGGLTLALEPWCKPIAYVEIEEYAQRIIAERMADGSLPRAPVLADVKNIEGKPGDCDIIVGGFPCQDISKASQGQFGRGLEGKRSGLFFEIERLTKEIQPSFVFLENVPAIRARGLYQVAESFTKMGYDCRWTSVSANYVGAPHQRERWFFLANSIGKRGRTFASDSRKMDTKQKVLRYCDRETPSINFKESCESNRTKKWAPEPTVDRVANGTAFRVDRLKALGNGVVPAQARLAFRYLIGEVER